MIAALTLLLALHAAAPMPAADAATAAAARDCSGCHVLDNPQGSPPIIDGQHAVFLAAQLRAFRDRHRNAFPMGMLSEGLAEERIDALAELYAARPWPDVDHRLSATAVDAGSRVAVQAGCAACHGQDWRGGAIIPRLAGQVPSYLSRQLRAMLDGRRPHPPLALEAADLDAVAAFLAAQR